MEPPQGYTLISFITIFAFLVSNAFFVAVEAALIRSHAAKLRSQENKNKFGMSSALYLLSRSDTSLASCQLGITASTIFLGWFGLTTFLPPLQNLSISFASFPYINSLLGFLLAGMIIWAHVVVGEFLGKAIAIRHPEAVLRATSPIMIAFIGLAKPLILTINIATRTLVRLFKMDNPTSFGRIHSSSELALLISQSSEEGVLDEEEKEMLHGIIGFSETVAREVMTPRTDVISIPKNASKQEVLEIVASSGHSRFPIISDTIDHVEGILLMRDLFPSLLSMKPFSLTPLIREAYFVPGTKPIDDLLNEFKVRKLHMAVVLDEHGGVDGVVTLEDLIEEIVGEIYDESDIPESDIMIAENGDALIDGSLLVSDVNQEFSLQIPEGEYDTIGGFIFSSLGRLPKEGDYIYLDHSGIPLIGETPEVSSLEIEDASLSDFGKPISKLLVERVSGNRIETLRLVPLVSESSLAA